MTTEETSIKNKLNRRDDKIAKLAKLLHERITFGPFAAAGLADRLTFFGSAAIAVEV